jgi:hypothetical protein
MLLILPRPLDQRLSGRPPGISPAQYGGIVSLTCTPACGRERSRREHAVFWGGKFMRLIRHLAVSAGLSAGLLSSAALAMGGLTSVTGSPALASAVASPGNATAAVNPTHATPGSQVTFAISCASLQASSATLFGSMLGLPDRIPMARGAADGDFVITVTLPGTIQPGNFTPDMDCSDGSSASATLTVTALPAHGGAETGDGTTSTQTSTGLVLGGLALICIGAVTGGMAMRHRNAVARRP